MINTCKIIAINIEIEQFKCLICWHKLNLINHLCSRKIFLFKYINQSCTAKPVDRKQVYVQIKYWKMFICFDMNDVQAWKKQLCNQCDNVIWFEYRETGFIFITHSNGCSYSEISLNEHLQWTLQWILQSTL